MSDLMRIETIKDELNHANDLIKYLNAENHGIEKTITRYLQKKIDNAVFLLNELNRKKKS